MTMALRPKNPREARKYEIDAFAEMYDGLTLVYGDPVEVVFQIMSRHADANDPEHYDPQIAKNAAETLMSYRFPRIKAAEGVKPTGPVMNFIVNAGTTQLQPPTVDVTPEAPQLDVLGVDHDG